MMSVFTFISKMQEFFKPPEEASRRIKSKRIKDADDLAKDVGSYVKTLRGVAWQVLGFALVVAAIILLVLYVVRAF